MAALALHPPFCSCCGRNAIPPGLDIRNRPGLSAISYRVGTFGTFRADMLEAIADHPALAALTTRESDDYGITLIELFAAVGDVLAFYNERIANELFLRTARERDSVLRLTRLIGYRMRPGLAAETMLSFTLDAGATTKIRKGLKVMSVPAQDQRAQIFETLEPLVASAALNDLPAFAPPVLVNALRRGSTGGLLTAKPEKLAIGDRLILFGLGAIEEKTVATLETPPKGPVVGFAPAIQIDGWWSEVTRIAKSEGRLRFFGHNAPQSVNVYVPPSGSVLWPKWETRLIDGAFSASISAYPLETRVTDLKSGSEVLVDAGIGAVPRLRTATIVKTEEIPVRLETLEDTVTYLHLRQTLRGRPTVLAMPFGGHAVLARSGTGAVMALEQPGSGLRSFIYEGIDTGSSDVAAVAPSAARADLFVRDRFFRLRQRVFPSGSPTWVDHGGILTSEPRALAGPGGTVTVFMRGLDLGLWHLDATSGTPGSWTSLGGILTSAPVPVSLGGANRAVFVRGLDRALWFRMSSGGAWSDWAPLKGVLAGTPAAASTGPGRIDVVAVDDDGHLVHRRLDAGQWSDWRHCGGSALTDPIAVAGPGDRVDILATDDKGTLQHIARIGASWTGWTALDGGLSSPPAAARDGTGLHVYARGGDGSIAYRALLAGGWTGWSSHGDGIGAITDRRRTAIWRLAPDDLRFRDYDYPDASGGRIAVRLDSAGADADGLASLAKGRRILLSSGGRQHLATVTAAGPVAAVPGDTPDHLFVDFTPALDDPMTGARLAGNLAVAGHGETQPDEPLGHGEAAKAFQSFRLARPNVTYRPSATSLTGTTALDIRVNGELWQEVPSLYGRKPGERVYTARQTDAAETIVTFGDGRTGARVPSGALNIIARYRTGLGLEGVMQPGQLSIPLERPVGLRAVANPLVADGAVDPEPRDAGRQAAPATVRTFGRAVSLADLEQITTGSGIAARALATWVWRDFGRAAHLTVAGPGGIPLSPLSLDRLHAALDNARDPNRPLALSNLVRVPVVVAAKILRDPAFEADAVLDAARGALTDFFAFERMGLGEAVFLSGVFAALQGARGVAAVDIDLLQLKGFATLTATERAIRAVTAEPQQPHIRIFPARPLPPLAQIDRFARAGFEAGHPPPVLAAEQAFIETPATDIALTIVEAL